MSLFRRLLASLLAVMVFGGVVALGSAPAYADDPSCSQVVVDEANILGSSKASLEAAALKLSGADVHVVTVQTFGSSPSFTDYMVGRVKQCSGWMNSGKTDFKSNLLLLARLRVMQAGLNKLKLQDAAAKAKSGASDAIEMAGEALDAANNGGFDSIKGAIEQRSAEADARFDRVVGGLQAGQSPEEAAKLARANAAIAALRAKMTAKATSQDSAS